MKTLLNRKLVVALVMLFMVINMATAQTNIFPSTGAAGIGTTTPNASSLLEIKSTSKGFLAPRMTLAQRNAIATPATGLMIYQTNSTPGFYYYNGTAWAAISTKGANTSLSNLVTTSIDSSLLPAVTNNINLGSGALRWKDVNLYNLKFSDGTTQTTAFTPYTAGAGISIASNIITNSAPDKTVVLSSGTGISVSGTYPNFTVTNSAPDKTVALTAGTGISVTGTYPNFTIASTGGNANQALSNLTATSINQSLVPNSNGAFRLGQRTLRWDSAYLNGLVFGNGSIQTVAFTPYTAGNGLSLSGTTFTNTAPDKIVTLTGSGGTTVSGTYPNFTISSSSSNSYYLSTTIQNTSVGYQSFSSNQSGFNNTSTGVYSLNSNTSGYSNTATGHQALFTNETGNNNAAYGESSLYLNDGGNFNTAIGSGSLFQNSGGSYNTATGSYALSNNGADNNTATGAYTLYSNTTGTSNAAQGYKALYSNTTGINNTADGYTALYLNTTGFENTANGESALFSNQTGSYNTASGVASLANSTGSYNTAVGDAALLINTTGSQNTGLGYDVDVSTGNLLNATAIGANAKVNASNKIRLGDANITVVESQVGSWTTSDGRFKNNIKEDVKGLEFIKLLRPVTYNFDTKKFEEFLMQNYPDSIKQKRLAQMDKETTAKASGIIQSGFIAQEVEEAIKKSGYNFNGVHAPDNPTDNWSLSYEKLTVPLVKAVQELSKMNDAKDAKIDALQKQLNDLKTLVLLIQQKQENCSPCSASINQSSNQSAVVLTNENSLQQNIPNPFNHTTTISYSLPQKFTSAQIMITDKNGKTLKAITISGNGKGNITVDASTRTSGAYQYSLIVDGRLIDTKQMILTK